MSKAARKIKRESVNRRKATGVPIFPQAELNSLPLGGQMFYDGKIIRKADENELITRKQARQEKQAMLEAYVADMTRTTEYINKRGRAADKAVWAEYAERRAVFASLLFVGDPTWKDGLTVLRTSYNKKTSAALDEIRKLRKDWENDGDFEMVAAYSNFESALINQSSNLNEAIRKAISENDLGSSLRELSQTSDLSILSELDELLNDMRTEGIATDRRWDRDSVWIGWQCNKMEATKQSNSIEQMWKALNRRISVKRDVWGDELEALEWFRSHVEYFSVERINHDVSLYKNRMKPYYESREKSRER